MRILGLSHQMKLNNNKLHQDMGIQHSDFKALSKDIYFFKQL